MKRYHRIIVAIDVYAEYDPILQCALSIADSSKDVFLVFVTLPISYFEPYISDSENSFVKTIHLQARKRLLEIATQFCIPKRNTFSPFGDISTEIERLATNLEADLIVLGTHNKKSAKHLSGSIAHKVVQNAKQDTLVVRVGEFEQYSIETSLS